MRFALAAALVPIVACSGDYPSDDAARAKVLCACEAGFGFEREASGSGTTCDCTGAAGQPLCTPGDDSTCGADESCRSTAGSTGACVCACDDTWSCDGPCACDPECTSTEVKCDADADCDAAACEVCNLDGHCVAGCDGGRSCDGAGACVAASCEGPADCYPTGYCSTAAVCEDLASLAGCPATASVLPAADANGPILFGGTQQDLGVPGDPFWCTKEPATCTNNGNVCAWRMSWFDLEGDVTSRALYSLVRFLRSSDGVAVYSYNVTDVAAGSFLIHLCYDETTLAPSGAALLYDDADHRSNPVCLAGQAP